MKQHFRTLWISDTHLGGRNFNSEKLYKFLHSTDSEYLYLVGDIFDLWKLKEKRWFWPEINDKIVKLVLAKAAAGTKIYYIPGNHDEVLRKYVGSDISGIHFEEEMIHTTVSGQKMLVLHGDKFDCVVQNRKWLADLGSILYDMLLLLNLWYNRYRSWRGKKYFSVSAYLKIRCKQAVNYMSDFEEVLIDAVEKNGVDGIICGHIHHASLRSMGRYLYANSGDWVESCTALAENEYGQIGIMEWMQQPLTVDAHKPVRDFSLETVSAQG